MPKRSVAKKVRKIQKPSPKTFRPIKKKTLGPKSKLSKLFKSTDPSTSKRQGSIDPGNTGGGIDG